MNEQTEDPVPVTVQDHIPTNTEDDGDDDLVGIQARVGSDGKKTVEVPLDTIIGLRRGNRELKGKLKESEAIAARTADVEGRLAQAQPIIGAILNNPRLRAEALKIAGGTHATPATSEQPDDAEAMATAEDMGWYQGDGVTPDAARAQRYLTRLDARMGRVTQEAVRPLAGLTLSRQAHDNVQRAINMVDAEGTPYATREGIEAAAKQLPPHLLANEQVAQILLRVAIGEDRLAGRTPKAQDEPMFMDSQSGRGQRAPAISQGERNVLKRYGIDEKTYAESSRKLENAVASRRGVDLE